VITRLLNLLLGGNNGMEYKMKLTYMGLTIEIQDDGDGFPIINIETGGNYLDQNDNAALDIILNGKNIHQMFEGI
jgi:hypothetical protein